MENSSPDRFRDANLRLADFGWHLLVHCPKCDGRAEIITERQDVPHARGGGVEYHRELRCTACFYNKRQTTRTYGPGISRDGVEGAFETRLWFSAPFRDEVFWACNYEHLDYLKRYIAALVRERRDRRFFTAVERLPQFVKSAKNREALLRLIEKLGQKN
jgi:hypothetical protein